MEHFCDEIVEYLVTQQEDLLPQLKPHLQKTTHTYRDLIRDLYDNKPMRSRIDFYFCAARLFLNQPVLLKPFLNKNIQHGTTGPKYLFQKVYLLETDKYMATENIKMRFVFNGVDYYCPFYPECIAAIMREGVPMLRDIQNLHKDLTVIMAKMPLGKSINSGLKLMHFHLSAVAVHTSFATGCSDTSVVDQPGPGMDPLISAPLHKRKSTKSINTENS